MRYTLLYMMMVVVVSCFNARAAEPLNDSIMTEDLLNLSVESTMSNEFRSDHKISPYKRKFLENLDPAVVEQHTDKVAFISRAVVRKNSSSEKDITARIANADLLKRIIKKHSLSLLDVSVPQVADSGKIRQVFERFQGATLDYSSEGLTKEHIQQLMRLVELSGWRDARPRNLVYRKNDNKLCIIDTDRAGFKQAASLKGSLEQLYKELAKKEQLLQLSDSDTDSSQPSRSFRVKGKRNYSELEQDDSSHRSDFKASPSKRRKNNSPSSSQDTDHAVSSQSPSAYLKESMDSVISNCMYNDDRRLFVQATLKKQGKTLTGLLRQKRTKQPCKNPGEQPSARRRLFNI